MINLRDLEYEDLIFNIITCIKIMLPDLSPFGSLVVAIDVTGGTFL